MTRTRLTFFTLVFLSLTACGQLLDASADTLSLGANGQSCSGGTGPSGGGAGTGNAGSAGSAGATSSGGSSGASGRAGSSGNAGTGNAGAAGSSGAAGSAGKGGASGAAGSAGHGGTAGSAGTAGAAGGAGQAGSENAGSAGAPLGGSGGTSGGAGMAGTSGGGAGGSPTTGSPYGSITSTEFTAFEQAPLTGVVGDLAAIPAGTNTFQVFAREESTKKLLTASFTKNTWDAAWTPLQLETVDSAPAAAFDGFGNVLHVLALEGSTLVNFYQPTEDDGWSQHNVNDPAFVVLTSPPAAVRGNDKRPQVFSVDVQGHLRTASVDNGNLSTWQNLGEQGLGDAVTLAPATAPAAVRSEEGVIDLFARSSEDTLIHCQLLPGQSFCGWELWSGVTLKTAPAVASWASERLDVVVRDDSSGQLMYRAKHEDGTLAPGWTPLPSVTSVGAPSVVAPALKKLFVLVHDSAGNVSMARLKP